MENNSECDDNNKKSITEPVDKTVVEEEIAEESEEVPGTSYETSSENQQQASTSSATTASNDRNKIYKLKYDALATYFHSLQKENCTIREKLLRCDDCIKGLQKKRAAYMKRLDYFGDDYRNSKRRYVLMDKNEVYLSNGNR